MKLSGRKLMISFVLTVMFVVGLGISAQPVHACSCVMNSDPLSSLAQASAVFSGKVIKLGEVRVNARERLKTALIEVDQIWKGIDQSQMWVYTAYGGEPSCGIEFVEGESYLIYSRADDAGRLNVSLCSRTTNLQSANDDLQALGDGMEPNKEVDLLKQSAWASINQSLMIIAAGLLIIVIAGVGFLLLMKRRAEK